jgi:predicted lipoprotein
VLRVLAITSITSLAVACGPPTAGPDATPDGFDRNALLLHLGTNVLLPIHAAFDTKAAAMPAAIAAYCDALDAGSATAQEATARAAWLEAMLAWERADELIVGPAAMDNRALRDRVYAWPLVSTCEIDRDVASQWGDPAGYDITTKLARRRSLAAIEWLLYPPNANHTCLNEPVGWSTLGADLPRARCRLALRIATDVAGAAAMLHTAWRADGGNYVDELARAGKGSSLPSAHGAVNAVSDSFFYVDRMVKDMKLAEPAGIAINSCGTVQQPCLGEVELLYSGGATLAIRANLAALREAFTGTTATADGPGFDDFIAAVGHPDVAAEMTADLDAAIAKASALPDAFVDALTTNYPDVAATHAAIRQFTNDLKSQFLTLLALDIPDDVASDND